MPRGFKRDEAATKAANFHDSRSFVSQPKIVEGECTEPKPHLVLARCLEDKGPIRAEIFRRNRVKWNGTNRCDKCELSVTEGPSCFTGEWDHIRNKPGERCDCPENGRVACRACHKERHPKPMWTKPEKVSEKGS